MPCCVLIGCRNNLKATKRAGKNVSYHIFPKNPQRRSSWINSLNQSFKFNADSSYICSEHFVSDDYECYSLKEELLNIKVKRQLKKTAIPSINLPKSLETEVSNISTNFLSSPVLNQTNTIRNESVQPIKKLKIDAIPTLNGEPKIIEVRNVEAIERKKLVNKLLADYEEQQKNEGYLKDMVTKYPNFFSPKINPNAKLGDKLKLIKSIDNPQFTPLPKKKLSETTKPNQECLEQSVFNNSSQNKDNVIQVSAVKGGIMLHALPQITNAIENTDSTKCVSNEDEESEEIIIVTEDEAHNTDLSLYEEQQKENNTEIVIVTNLKETEETLRHIESSPKNNSTQIYDSNNKHFVHNKLENNLNQFTPLYTAKVSLNEEKGCQVIIPCKDCEHKSFKINKLLRERTRLLKDLNQNGTWKNPNEINTLKRMNGVLSMLLMQCIGKKPSSIRVDLVQDSIERVDSGWSMQNTSEVLCQALSVNAYDEFVKTFQIINEI